MKTKTLAVTNGVVGLLGGIFLLFAIWFILGVASSGSEVATGINDYFVYLVKVSPFNSFGILVLYIYKGDTPVRLAFMYF